MFENIRRFWPIPVLAFLVYFLSGPFPILINYSDLSFMGRYIQNSLENQQPFFMGAHLLFPVITAVLIFRYLQGVSSVSVMHTMPFTRTKLFFSNFLSGFLLSFVPVLLNGLIFLVSAKPVYDTIHYFDSAMAMPMEKKIDVFSRMAICEWIWQSFIIIFFIFTISVFAGIITGNSLMHFAAAIGFNFLTPVFYGTLLSYFDQYLFGFSFSNHTTDYILRLSPYLLVFEKDNFTMTASLAYLLVSILIIGLSLFLYQKRALEKATDSLVFSFMEPIICYQLTFFAMSLFGLYFSVLEESRLYIYAGYIAGTLIGFIASQMIVKKTVRISIWAR